AGAVAAWLLSRKTAAPDAGPSGATLSNPFSLTAALSFAGVYALIRLVAQAAQEHFGASGLYVAAAFSALADVDAVTIAFTRLGPGASGWQVPAAAVTIAVVTNTLVKLGIALATGARRFRLYVTLALGVSAVLGALAGTIVFV